MRILSELPAGKRLKIVFSLSPSPEQVEAGLLKSLEGTTLTFELLRMLFWKKSLSQPRPRLCPFCTGWLQDRVVCHAQLGSCLKTGDSDSAY